MLSGMSRRSELASPRCSERAFTFSPSDLSSYYRLRLPDDETRCLCTSAELKPLWRRQTCNLVSRRLPNALTAAQSAGLTTDPLYIITNAITLD